MISLHPIPAYCLLSFAAANEYGLTEKLTCNFVNTKKCTATYLETALWCFARSSSFEDAVLRAANLGDDSDNTAVVCGQVAGAHYGLYGIPLEWIEKLAMKEKLLHLSETLFSGQADHG